ncbi:hypothetical protein TWF281_003846 [Arthrobotrys megalospora]
MATSVSSIQVSPASRIGQRCPTSGFTGGISDNCSSTVVKPAGTGLEESRGPLAIIATKFSPLASGDLLKVLHFYSPPTDNSSPYFVVTHHNGTGRKKYSHDPVIVLIRDIRGKESLFSLPVHSFQPFAWPAAIPYDLLEDEKFMEVVHSSTREVLHHFLPNIQNVVVFDHTIRKASNTAEMNCPVRKVHIDQTPAAAIARAKLHLSEEEYKAVAEEQVRPRIINVWRPLKPVYDHPLAVAESDSVDSKNLVEFDHVYSDRVGQTYGVKYSAEQRYWYWSGMSPTEGLLLLCYDSGEINGGEEIKDVRCAHAAFEISKPEKDRKERESVEVRRLVIG